MIKICPICKNRFYVRPSYIKEGRGKYCSKNCSGKAHIKDGNLVNFQKGYTPWNKGKKMPQVSREKHWNWKGGKHSYGSDAYIYILKPNHPFATKRGYIAEHRFIMEQKLRRYLKPSERIHHLNGNKQDNRQQNLKLFDCESSHRKYHFTCSHS